jgi:hypothetical protein
VVSCAYVHPLCAVRKINLKKEIYFLTMKKKKKTKMAINLILSHANPTFFILDLPIEPQTFRHTHPTLRKSVFLMWRRVQFKVQFASNWSFGFWSLDPKWPLNPMCQSCWYETFQKYLIWKPCWFKKINSTQYHDQTQVDTRLTKGSTLPQCSIVCWPCFRRQGYCV